MFLHRVQAEHELASRGSLSDATKATVTFLVSDAAAAKFDAASFDTILCCNAMQWFPDMHDVIASARGWLKPGGCLAFNVTASTKNVRL